MGDFVLVRKMRGKVIQVKPVVIRWDVLESGIRRYYQDKTFTNLLRRVKQ